MPEQMVFDHGSYDLTVDKQAPVASSYGWTVDHAFEWQLDVRFTSRQDGRTAWAVILTQVDGDITVRQGLTSTGFDTAHRIQEAVMELSDEHSLQIVFTIE